MSLVVNRELLRSVALRYRTAGRTEKSRIADEFVASTGYHRQYALALLKNPDAKSRKPMRHRKARFDPTVGDGNARETAKAALQGEMKTVLVVAR